MITKRGKLYYSDFEINGKRVRRSLKTGNEAEARAKSQALFAKISAGGNLDESGRELTIGYVIDYTLKHRWSKMRDHKKGGLCALVKAAIGADLPVDQINRRVLRSLQERMQADGASASTMNKYVNVVTGAIRFFYDHQDIDKPVPTVKRFREPELKVRYLSTAEIQAILAAEPDFRMRTFWQASMEIGSRCGDTRTMVWEDFDWENGMYVVGNGKVDKPQAVPLNRDLLERFQALRDRGYRRPFEYSNNDVRVAFRRVKRLAGINDPRVTPNTMRHTCATQLMAQGADMKEVQAWMGHSKITTTQRYVQVMPERLKRLRNTARNDAEMCAETVP